MTDDTQSLTFDHVQVGDNLLSVERFLALPVFERVEHILSGSLEFFLEGELVQRREALNALRTHSTQAS